MLAWVVITVVSAAPGSSVHLIFHSDAPQTELVRRGQGSVCVAPCELDLGSRAGKFQVRGLDVVPSEPFTLPEWAGAVRLDVRAASEVYARIGLSLEIAGPTLLAVTLILLSTSLVTLPSLAWALLFFGDLTLCATGYVIASTAKTHVLVSGESWPRAPGESYAP